MVRGLGGVDGRASLLRKRHRFLDECMKISFPIGHLISPDTRPKGPSLSGP